MNNLEECLKQARISYERELGIIRDMVEKGDVAEDESFPMQKIVYQFYQRNFNRCWIEFAGRPAPGLTRL